MSKAFLHIGAHKTATTFIQANLLANRSVFDAQGWRFVHFHKEVPDVYEQWKKFRRSKKIGPRGTALLSGYFEDMRRDRRNIFLSSEVMLGHMSLKRTGTIYENHTATIQRLKSDFSDREVKIGFCIRNFADYVQSSYSWLVSHGAQYSFQTYIENIQPEKLSWSKTISGLADAFGGENLIVWTYEDFKKDSAASLLEIIRVAGLDPATFSICVSEPRNVSQPPDVTEALQKLNVVLHAEGRRIDHKLRTKLRREMVSVLSRVPKLKSPPSFLEAAAEARFAARYEDDAAFIREQWPNVLLKFPSSSEKQTSVKFSS